MWSRLFRRPSKGNRLLVSRAERKQMTVLSYPAYGTFLVTLEKQYSAVGF
jgi:hypothetical protein